MPDLFLGTDPHTKKIERLPLERHALTIAGARMGKGACQIIPTLKEWPSSAIIVDPKTEAVIETIEERSRMGQQVAILDPMGLVPKEFETYQRVFDPLSMIRPGGAGFRDLLMIADGVVLTTGQEHDPHWNESALSTIAGLSALLLEAKSDEQPHLGHLPQLVRRLRDSSSREDILKSLAACRRYGRLAADLSALFSVETNETSSILSATSRHLRFLGDEDVVRVLRPPTDPRKSLDLSGLRTGKLTLYVVIDPGSMVLHGRFLRLFVRMALSVMMDTTFSEGSSKNAPCLFVLDEFFSLGKIAEIQKAAGLMPGYGVHLWPILQDWGQLVDLYGPHGAQTFLANADAVSVFGVSDHATLQEVSNWFGEASVAEIEHQALALAQKIESSEAWRKFGALSTGQGDYIQNQHLAMLGALLQAGIGRPRKSAAEIQYHIGKGENDRVARNMFVFLRTGRILDLKPTPHFE